MAFAEAATKASAAAALADKEAAIKAAQEDAATERGFGRGGRCRSRRRAGGGAQRGSGGARGRGANDEKDVAVATAHAQAETMATARQAERARAHHLDAADALEASYVEKAASLHAAMAAADENTAALRPDAL